MVNIELLKAEIEDLGVTKGKIAEKCGISRPTLESWLERPELISAKGAKALADALRITEPEKLLAIFFADEVDKNVNV